MHRMTIRGWLYSHQDGLLGKRRNANSSGSRNVTEITGLIWGGTLSQNAVVPFSHPFVVSFFALLPCISVTLHRFQDALALC